MEQMRENLQEAGTSTILVTHDIHEAFHLAGRIGVMRSGRLIQEGSPSQLLFAVVCVIPLSLPYSVFSCSDDCPG